MNVKIAMARFGYCRGFTLIELVVTMVILGVISATAAPKLFNLSAYQQKVFFDDTLNAIRYAQKLAVVTSCNVQVKISNNQYTLSRPTPTDRTKCTSTTASDFTLAVTRPGSGEASYQNSQSGISLTSATFYFTAKGNSSASLTLVVGTQQIAVVQGTGFVYAP